MSTIPIDRYRVLQLAVRAHVDPRTVVAYYRGRQMRALVAARLAEAVAALGFPPAPSAETEDEARP